MYITRFIRTDEKPEENYYYQTLEEAEKHLHLFDNDDSGLYRNISILDDQAGKVLVILLFKDGKVVDTFKEGDCIRLNKEFCEPGEEQYIFAIQNLNEATGRAVISCLNSKLVLGSSESVGLEMIHTIGTTVNDILEAAKENG